MPRISFSSVITLSFYCDGVRFHPFFHSVQSSNSFDTKSSCYLKSAVETRNVDEDERDQGLEDDGEVQHPVAHAALEHRKTTRSGKTKKSEKFEKFEKNTYS